MSHPLAGAWAKVRRAREHLDILKAETAPVVKANKCLTHIEQDPQTGDLVISVKLPNGPFVVPSRLGLIAGDAIHNLRSALDHVAYALAGVGTGPTRTTQFPLMEKADDFWRNEDRLLAGVIKGHRATIESLQPYHARQLPAATFSPHDPLVINACLMGIGRLDNMDKHRGLLAGAAIAPWQQPKFGGVKKATGTYPGDAIRVQDGAELYRIKEIEFLPGHTHVEVQTQPTYGITFGNPEWGELGSPDDIWSSENKGALSRTDIVIAADIVDRVIGMFEPEFRESST